jgi:hypothetical protein
MRRDLQLESRWNALMSLCGKEREYQASGRHPKLLKLVREQIVHLAGDLGFSERQIKTREFRADKSDGHIVLIIGDSTPPRT